MTVNDLIGLLSLFPGTLPVEVGGVPVSSVEERQDGSGHGSVTIRTDGPPASDLATLYRQWDETSD